MSSQTAPKQPKQPSTLKNRKIFVSQIDTSNLNETNCSRVLPSSQPSTCNNAMPTTTISPLNKMQPNVRSVRHLVQQFRTDASHSPARTKSTRALSSQQGNESVKDTSLKMNFSKVEQRPKNGAASSPSSREKSKRRKRATTAKNLEVESLLQEPKSEIIEALVSPHSGHAKKKSQGHKNEKMMKLLQSCVPSTRAKKLGHQGHQAQSMAFNTSLGLDITADFHHMSISHLRKPSNLQDGSWESLNKPVAPQVVLDQFSSYLSAYEKEEIKEYSEIYFLGDTQNKVINQPVDQVFDDERGDYTIVPGDHIRYQYEVIEILGRGAFGQVVKVFDHKSKEYLALKIIRNHKKIQAQAKIEIRLLEFVTANKGSDYNVVEVKHHFTFRQHICMLFDLMSMNLYDFLRKNKFQGLNTNLLKNISTQLLLALKFLNHHKIIHCDIKPENILFRYPNKTGIRLIDFGSSCFEDEKLYTYIQSRFYRSPEIILGLNYNTQIDMWSFGCLLCELYTGNPIFAGDSENDQLAAMMEVLGAPDAQLLSKASRKKLYFDDNCFPKLVPNTKGRTRIPGSIPLSSIITGDKKFLDFIQQCLNYDPKKRFTPDDALAHPWIQDDFPHEVKSQHIKLIEKVGDKSPIGDSIGSKFALDLRPLNDKDCNSVIIQDSKPTRRSSQTRGLDENSMILPHTETLQREVSYGSVDFSTVKQINNENKPKSKSIKKGTKHVSNQSSLVINTSINLGRSAQNSLRSKATKSKDNLLSMLNPQSPKENLKIPTKCENLSLKNRDQNKLIEKLSKVTPANKSSERQLNIGISLKENVGKTIKDKASKENKGKEEENVVGKLSLVDPKNKSSKKNLNGQKSIDMDSSKILMDVNGTVKSPKNVICLSLKSPKLRKMV